MSGRSGKLPVLASCADNDNLIERHDRVADLSAKLLWPAVAFFLLVKLWLSFTRYLNQDEFESLHQGWLMFSGAIQFRDFNSNHPPVSFAVLSFLNYLTSDSVTLIRLGRLLTFISSIACLGLLYSIGRSVYGRCAARWTVIVYATSATFLEWSVEIRSDFVMVPLWLAAVATMLRVAEKPRLIQAGLVGFLMGVAFWANQKVVFHAIPLLCLMLAGGIQGGWRFRHTLCAAGASLIPTVAFCLQAVTTGSLADLIQHNFLGAWGLVESGDYDNWRSITLRRGFACDMGFVVLGVAASVWAIGSERSRSSRFIGFSASWMLVSLFLTPGPFHYYLLSVFPMYAVAIGGFLQSAQDRWASDAQHEQQPVLVVTAVICFMIFPLARLSRFVVPTMSYQNSVLRLASQITGPESRVFDGAGTLVNRSDAYPFHWVLWKGEIQRYRAGLLPSILPALRQNQCALVLDTYRLAGLPEQEQAVIRTHFVPWWGPIRVPGFEAAIGDEAVEFELWQDGEYVANRQDLLVDGKPMTSPRFLEAGKHTIALPHGSGKISLRMVTAADEMRPPSDEIDPATFLGKYGYHY